MMPDEKEVFEVYTPYGDKEFFVVEHPELSKGP
jgi:hypothetical protein